MQDRFIRAYLESALALQHCTGFVASDKTEGALEEAAMQLLQAANAYIPMSHLIWGLWGLLQVRTASHTCLLSPVALLHDRLLICWVVAGFVASARVQVRCIPRCPGLVLQHAGRRATACHVAHAGKGGACARR